MRLAFFLSSYCGKPWASLWSSLCSLGISSPSLSTPGEKIKTPHNHKWQLLVATFTFTIKWHKHLLVATFPFHTWQQEIWPQGWKTTSTSLSMQTWRGKMGKGYLFVCPFVCLSICLFVHLFVCPFVCLSCLASLYIFWSIFENLQNTASCSSLPVKVLLPPSTFAFQRQAGPEQWTFLESNHKYKHLKAKIFQTSWTQIFKKYPTWLSSKSVVKPRAIASSFLSESGIP